MRRASSPGCWRRSSGAASRRCASMPGDSTGGRARWCSRPRRSSSVRATCRRTSGATSSSPPSACSALRSRSEEHTSELQSPCNLVCRLLLEKKNYQYNDASRDHDHHPPYSKHYCPLPSSIKDHCLIGDLERMSEFVRSVHRRSVRLHHLLTP